MLRKVLSFVLRVYVLLFGLGLFFHFSDYSSSVVLRLLRTVKEAMLIKASSSQS
jgi:hypothetical protein